MTHPRRSRYQVRGWPTAKYRARKRARAKSSSRTTSLGSRGNIGLCTSQHGSESGKVSVLPHSQADLPAGLVQGDEKLLGLSGGFIRSIDSLLARDDLDAVCVSIDVALTVVHLTVPSW